ncbi:hypothetical protein [Candidatus Methanomassiliicoccus intestinalis]|uniref:hypothetical protein n=1 Tax=Candidatus Methanomassiliicoccus intestinalis TaxID=1406512 RepID=UPI0037DD2D37
MSDCEFKSALDILQARIDASYTQDKIRHDCCEWCIYNFDHWHCGMPNRCTTDRDKCLTCPPCKHFERVRKC